ncbi:hypothetical protein BDU57DRAFT_568071 [Ampelomyces quisqualis]|uniref:Uncharacterized protein n=1 Tax=Ampelomyces quisqualis TaxID=50730 RepID=A0A6A5QWR6_AMPQU|nr:hypothetical protein BDU57DRAFT_568071 [Ampelomyces quisqualis]
MRCSSFADDFFTFEPNATSLHLSVCYPRQHISGCSREQFHDLYRGQGEPLNWDMTMNYRPQVDDQLAYIREREITKYIIPWLKNMEKALIRSPAARQNSKATAGTKILDDANQDKAQDDLAFENKYWPMGSTREWLVYSTMEAGRRDYPDDTISLPPRLEVIGHCISNWSDVRRNGNIAAAHTGFPLNVGRVNKYYRRRATSPIRKEANPIHGPRNFEDYSTYRLHHLKYFHDHAPGSLPEQPAGGNQPTASEDPQDSL